MAILVDVTVDGGAVGTGQGVRMNIPRHTFQVAIESNKQWRLWPPLTPYWRYLFDGNAMGYCYQDTAGTYICMDATRKKTLLEIRSVDQLRGSVFYWPRAGNRGATLYDGTGSWAPSGARQPKTWIGFAVKAAAGAGVSGEAAFGAVVQIWGNNTSGCSFMTTTGRLGAVAGFSGGLAFVYATGFARSDEFRGFTSSGADFALACGPKIAGAVNPKWGKVASIASRYDKGLELVEGIVKGNNPKYADLRGELPGIAKSISQSALIDPDDKNITVLDVPLCGAGAEVGVYYGWSNTTLLSSW